MSYLKFDKEQLVNLEYSLNREILRSNRAGSYISTTLNGCNTRKYHGLLVCPIENFANDKHVLLSSLDTTVLQQNTAFNLGIHRYKGGTYDPKGHKYIKDIVFDKVPKIRYRIGGVVLTMERLLVEKQEQILIRYTLEKAQSKTILRFKPFLAFRNVHKLSKSNMFANTKFQKIENGISMKIYEGFPNLHMQISKKNEFIPFPDWYYDIEYSKELNRGYEHLEDLYVPGYFEVHVKTGESIVFAAGTSETKAISLKQRFTKEVKKRGGRVDFLNSLKNASEQFITQKNNKTDIIAGFPWYGSISRQTLISLPGISFALNKTELFPKILNHYKRYLKKGLLPDKIDEITPEYHSPDASLWFIWSIQQYFKQEQNAKKIWADYGDSIIEILKNFKNSTPDYLHHTSSGLLYTEKPQVALTWMNSTVNGVPVVQRSGLTVELNALWFNALCFALDLADFAGKKEFIEEWKEEVNKTSIGFLNTFWNNDHGHLADVVFNNISDWSIRPNMVIAAAMDYSPLSPEQKKSVLSITKRKLLTNRGLRTLSPDHLRYKGFVEGNPNERETAIHQGAVHPFLIQFFVEAYLKIHKRGGIPFVKQITDSFEEELTEHCIGTISEMYNGTPPHRAKGAVSQAWNVAGVFYATKLIEECND